MKSTFDQICLDCSTMTYTLFLSVKGNQHRIPINHDSAVGLLDGVKHDIVKHENKVFWIPNPNQTNQIFSLSKLNNG